MKVILNYNPTTGVISDKNGAHIMSWFDLQYEETEQAGKGSVISESTLLKAIAISQRPELSQSLI